MFTLYRPAVLAACFALVALLAPAGPARAQAGGLTVSFENGTLAVHGTGFARSVRVTVETTMAGRRSTFTAETGANGAFSLHTNMPVTPKAPLQIEARDPSGTVQKTTTAVPAVVDPVRPIRLLPAPAGQPGAAPAPDSAADPAPANPAASSVALGVLALVVLGVALGVTRRTLRRGRQAGGAAHDAAL